MDTDEPKLPAGHTSAGLPTRSRCEGKTVLASPHALERAEPLRLGTAAVRRLRKVCAARHITAHQVSATALSIGSPFQSQRDAMFIGKHPL